jgi:hypothetical protein
MPNRHHTALRQAVATNSCSAARPRARLAIGVNAAAAAHLAEAPPGGDLATETNVCPPNRRYMAI